MYTWFWLEELKETNCLEDLIIDGRVILKLTLKVLG
jgi:hypothetical protein